MAGILLNSPCWSLMTIKVRRACVSVAFLFLVFGYSSLSILIICMYGILGEGLGGKLLRELIEHAKADGLDAIEAVVLQTNRAMIHVAEKAGFECIYDKEEGVVKQFLNLRDPHMLISMEEMKLRRFSAPICI